MSEIIIILTILVFLFYLLVRNHLVCNERLKMITFHYTHPSSPYLINGGTIDSVVSYDKMLLNFWVFPLSSFYPEYHRIKTMS